jgi:hypothetical protein
MAVAMLLISTLRQVDRFFVGTETGWTYTAMFQKYNSRNL